MFFGKKKTFLLFLSEKEKKELILRWCQDMVYNYVIEIKNMSSTWADGYAFCALLHSLHPDAFNFKSLDRSDRRKNLELAFETSK